MKYLDDPDLTLYYGDALEVLRTLPDESVHMCVTSPPFFGLRDYGTGAWEGGDEGCDHTTPAEEKPRERPELPNPPSGWSTRDVTVNRAFNECKCGATRVDNQIGLEDSPEAWAARLVEVFGEVRRVLRADGTCWIEVGDSYNSFGGHTSQGTTSQRKGRSNVDVQNATKRRANSSVTHGRIEGETSAVGSHQLKPKDLLLQPYLLASALRAAGWYLRGMYVWARPNPMPESVTDRCTTSHSFVIHLAKRARYFFDAEAIREPHQEPWRSGTNEAGPRGYEDGLITGKPKWEMNGREYNPAGRNARSVWNIATEANGLALCRVCNAYWEGGAPAKHCGEPVVGHYAAFPQKLVERCIKAGTSERGCCPQCLKPWVRVVEKSLDRDGARSESEKYNGVDAGFQTHPGLGRAEQITTTLGWQPSCSCRFCSECGYMVGNCPTGCSRGPTFPATTKPCTVLDPFSGSGTTLLVARRLGRHAIGIELNPHYAEMTSRRLAQLSLLGSA